MFRFARVLASVASAVVILSTASPSAGSRALTLAEFRALPADEQAARIERTKAPLWRWRRFEADVRDFDRHLEQSYRLEGFRVRRGPWGKGLPGAVDDLTEVTALDPSNAQAWLGLARYQRALGENGKATSCLAAAAAALADSTPAGARQAGSSASRGSDTAPWDGAWLPPEDVAPVGEPRPPDADPAARLALEIARAQAWLCRDEGRWDEGLAAAARGQAISPRDTELQVVRGLLLAGAGRFTEACALARDLPPIEFRRYGWMYTGLSRERSDYASRWIEAMAWLQQGDTAQAFAALGVLRPERPRIPFMHAYWNDVGLICELADRTTDAQAYHTLAAIAAPYRLYFPSAAFMTRDAAGLTAAGLPVVVSMTQGCIAGSLLGYGTQLALESAVEPDTARAADLARHAEAALSACARRGIRPEVAQAAVERLRGGRPLAAEASRAGAPRVLEDTRPLTRQVPSPDDPLFWSLIALYRYDCDQPGEGRRALDRAIRLAPGDAALSRLGERLPGAP